MSGQSLVSMLLTMCSPPVPAAPSTDQPFKLHVDASDVGVGAVLFQMVVV